MSAISIKVFGSNGIREVDADDLWRHIEGGLPVVLDGPSKALFADLRQRAEANVIDYPRMKKLADDCASGRQRGAPDYCIAQTVKITFGWTITYTVEEHKPGVPCRHLSIASPNPKRAPIPPTFDLIMPEFGFVGQFFQLPFWDEPLLHGGVAINVLEPMSGRMADIATSPLQ